jgi:predicted metal-binding membrane protein
VLGNFDLSVRSVLWLSFFSLILAAWVWMYQMARLAGLDVICAVPVPGTFSPEVFWSVYPMWLGMTAAMMLPTLVPTLRAYDDLILSVGPAAGADRSGWMGVVGGYFLVWATASIGFALAQTGLAGLGWVDQAGTAQLRYVSAALLIVAGIWQFTATKEHCRDACLSPAAYFIGRWRPGFSGALRMGAGLGAFCVGCCWALMALAFVGGIMNLAFMGLATVIMVMEKLPGIGRRITRPLGALLIISGTVMFAMPLSFLGG